MQRGFFSVFDSVYASAQKEHTSQVSMLLESCVNEVLALLLLSPFLPASLDAQPCQKLMASDVAPEFGFGVCTCDCSVKEGAGVFARQSAEAYVRLTADEGDIPRLGRPRRLKLHRKDFKTDIFPPRPDGEHILELLRLTGTCWL